MKHLLPKLLLCFVITGGCAAIYLGYINIRKAAIVEQKEQEQKKAIEIAKKTKNKRKKEIQTLFDTYLNEFQNDLLEKAQSYKKTRRLLRNIIRPINFETTDFAKENYDLFKESLVPSLRKKSADIIFVFEDYSEKIEKDLAGDKNEIKQLFLDKWKNMTKEQLDNYVDFFSREEEMIMAFDDLITFYYTHSKRYEIDTEKNRFLFSNKNENKKVKKLQERALALYKNSVR